jgi:hypothetical protein
MVGNLEDYEETKILGTNNPKERIEELATKVEKAFTTLNEFYQQLRITIEYKVVYNGIVNFHSKNGLDSTDREKREITSFQLARDNTQNGSFEIIPIDENHNEFPTHYANKGIDTNHFGNGNNTTLYHQIKGYEVTSKENCDYTQLSFSLFAQALVKLRELRNQLESVKTRIEITELRETSKKAAAITDTLAATT